MATRCVLADEEFLPFQENSFDLVVSSLRWVRRPHFLLCSALFHDEICNLLSASVCIGSMTCPGLSNR